MFNTKRRALNKWKKKAEGIQTDYNEFLGDRIWNAFQLSTQRQLLRDWICISLYGLPQKNNELNGLTPKEMEFVEEILEKSIESSDSTDKVSIAVFYAYVYISHKKPPILSPVLRVKSSNSADLNNNTVIDNFGRVYESWSDYKENNTWKRCWVCFPPSGFYNLSDHKSFEIFDYSSRGQAELGLDIASIVIGTISGAGAITGAVLMIFPPTVVAGLPLLITSLVISGITSAYGAGRSIYKLHIRNKRKQSLLDVGAGVEWMGAVFGTLGVILAPVTGGVAAAANVAKTAATLAPRIALGIVGAASGIANISRAGAGIGAIIHSIEEKECLTDLDFRKLQTALLFLVNLYVDEAIIRSYYETRQLNKASRQTHSQETIRNIRVVKRSDRNFRVENERKVLVIETLDKLTKYLQLLFSQANALNNPRENFESSEDNKDILDETINFFDQRLQLLS